MAWRGSKNRKVPLVWLDRRHEGIATDDEARDIGKGQSRIAV